MPLTQTFTRHPIWRAPGPRRLASATGLPAPASGERSRGRAGPGARGAALTHPPGAREAATSANPGQGMLELWSGAASPIPKGPPPTPAPRGAAGLGPLAQLCQVQCPLVPTSFPLVPALGSSPNQVRVSRASRSPVPREPTPDNQGRLEGEQAQWGARGALGNSEKTQLGSPRSVLGEGGARTRATGADVAQFLAPAANYSERRLVRE